MAPEAARQAPAPPAPKRTWRHVRARPVKAPVPAMCMRDRTTCVQAGRQLAWLSGMHSSVRRRLARRRWQHTAPQLHRGAAGAATRRLHRPRRGQRLDREGEGQNSRGAPRAGRWRWMQSFWRWPRQGSARSCAGGRETKREQGDISPQNQRGGPSGKSGQARACAAKQRSSRRDKRAAGISSHSTRRTARRCSSGALRLGKRQAGASHGMVGAHCNTLQTCGGPRTLGPPATQAPAGTASRRNSRTAASRRHSRTLTG